MRYAALVALLILLAGLGRAQEPLARPDFALSAGAGFGDRHNSWPWSMAWWPSQRKLLVGTARAASCTSAAALQLFFPRLPLYPPADPELQCTADPRDLPLRAEIWSWSPDDDVWRLAYRSPDDLEVPAYPGRFVARDVGFRGMHLFVEPDGTEALYVSGVSSRAFNEASKERYLADPQLPPPRLLRSTDGQTFEPVPQEPGTLWHQLRPLDGFRGMASFKDRLYVIASAGALGHGYLLESRDPAQGNDSFRKIDVGAADHSVFELAAFNGALYVGTGGQPLLGDPPFSVWKTDAAGEPPYAFERVIPPGAFRVSREASAAISMFVYRGRLYVGTGRELFRINPDDTWDLVVGAPRLTPHGRVAPLSGFGDGFGEDRNVHMWRMAEHQGVLYVGTLDSLAQTDEGGGRVHPARGFDMAATTDGWHFTRVTRNGLAGPSEQRYVDQGVRTLASTPDGLFVGATNPRLGLTLWRGRPGPRAGPPAPARVETEVVGDSVIVSWERVAEAFRYRVRRETATSGRELARGPREVDDVLAVVDRAPRAGRLRTYHVLAEDAGGRLSLASNAAPAPSQAAPVDFATVDAALARWRARPAWRSELRGARWAFAAGDHAVARRRIGAVSTKVARRACCAADVRSEDVRMLLDKLSRRVALVQLGLLPEAAVGGASAAP